MKILKRFLMDELDEKEQHFAMNADYVESPSTIVLDQDYEALVGSMHGCRSLFFFPENILERDFNKRFIDAAFEAGVARLFVIVSSNSDSIERETLRKYIEDYHGFEYLFLEIPVLMDELFIQMTQGKRLKNMPKHSLSSLDAMELIMYFYNLETLGEQFVSLPGVCYEESEKYYETFQNPDASPSMKIKKSDPFIQIIGRQPETWDYFVKRKKVS